MFEKGTPKTQGNEHRTSTAQNACDQTNTHIFSPGRKLTRVVLKQGDRRKSHASYIQDKAKTKGIDTSSSKVSILLREFCIFKSSGARYTNAEIFLPPKVA